MYSWGKLKLYSNLTVFCLSTSLGRWLGHLEKSRRFVSLSLHVRAKLTMLQGGRGWEGFSPDPYLTGSAMAQVYVYRLLHIVLYSIPTQYKWHKTAFNLLRSDVVSDASRTDYSRHAKLRRTSLRKTFQ